MRQWQLGLDSIAAILRPGTLWFRDLSPADKAAAREYKAEAMVASVMSFDHWYLEPTVENGITVHDPMFYGTWHAKTPEFHKIIYRALAMHKASIVVGPRGSAKTYATLKPIMLFMVSRPGYEILYGTSKQAIGKDKADRIRFQLYNNSLLQDDWSREYGIPLRPKRGDAPSGIESFVLTNRARFGVTAAGAIQRGMRPNLYDLDDPEYDPDASTDMGVLRQAMETLIFKIGMPMLSRPDAKIIWPGTFISQRHYLWMAMQTREITENGKTRRVSLDPRFDHWHRYHIKAVEVGPDGKERSCWPEGWPIDEAEKVRLKLPEEVETIPQIRARVGESSWAAEYMGEPGSGEGSHFGELNEEKHGWWIEEGTADDLLTTKPCMSQAMIVWKSGDKTMRMTLQEFCRRYARFITMDTSYTHKPDSDFKALAVLTLTDQNDLFVLDGWQGRTPQGTLVQEGIRAADRWGAGSIHPEAIKEGKNLCYELGEVVRTKACTEFGVLTLPAIVPFNPGVLDKGTKIGALLWRFEQGKIKLPVRSRHLDKWKPLFDQIGGFNPNADDLGLTNDDFLDCFPSETPITLRRGQVPICEVKIGDEAMTRDGWRRVLRVIRKGPRRVISRFGITATPEHRIWTKNRGWARLDSLAHDDIIIVCQNPQSKSSYSTEKNTDGGPTPNGGIFESTSGIIPSSSGLPVLCTLTCGELLTANHPTDFTSTTKTEIPSIITSPTSLASRPHSITPNTPPNDLLPVNSPSDWPGSRGCEQLDPAGSLSATSVKSCLPRSSPGGTSIVLPGVPVGKSAASGVQPIENDQTKTPDCGGNEIPKKHGLPKNDGGRETPKRCEIKSGDTIDENEVETWDLTVEHTHEFFAGGVLVHNCLAMGPLIGQRARPLKLPEEKSRSLLDLFRKGEVKDAVGLPLFAHLESTLTEDDITAHLDARARRGKSGTGPAEGNV